MLVLEYMEHGSLYDVLHNETMYIESNLILNILQDVSQGVRFLHSSIPQVIHGDLKAVSFHFLVLQSLCMFEHAFKRLTLASAFRQIFWLTADFELKWRTLACRETRLVRGARELPFGWHQNY